MVKIFVSWLRSFLLISVKSVSCFITRLLSFFVSTIGILSSSPHLNHPFFILLLLPLSLFLPLLPFFFLLSSLLFIPPFPPLTIRIPTSPSFLPPPLPPSNYPYSYLSFSSSSFPFLFSFLLSYPPHLPFPSPPPL